ncbi:transmembrane protein 140 [Lissotriton helveticus]
MVSMQGKKALLGFLCVLGLAVIVCTLLVYALIGEGGVFINTNTKKVGFLSFCLWNETMGKLSCEPHFDDLRRHGIVYPTGVAFGSVLGFCSLPIYVFVPLTLLFGQLGQSRSIWKLALGLSAITCLSLSIGIGTFLLFAGELIEASQLGYGFLALIAADSMVLLQGVAAFRMLPWFAEEEYMDDKV